MGGCGREGGRGGCRFSFKLHWGLEEFTAYHSLALKFFLDADIKRHEFVPDFGSA